VPVIWPGGGIAGCRAGAQGGRVRARPRRRALDWHIVAEPPLGGLEPNARPNPREIANNHWSYAIQWFAFAATALIIYLLALRRR
jgi:surfeit locus 1 family protein